MAKKTVQPQDKYVLRLPDGMRERIRQEAEASGRSMNAEMLDRLEYSFSAWPRLALPRELLARARNADVGLQIAYEAALMSAALDLFEVYFPKPAAYRDRIREAVDQYFDQLPNGDREMQRERLAAFLESMFREHGAEEARDGYGLRNIQRRFGEAADDDRQARFTGIDDAEPEDKGE